MKKLRNGKKKSPLGISVFCLRNTLLKEVKEAGKDETSSIYDIEDLRKKTDFGVIRSKGATIVCPRDNKIGAAYVDCLKGKDNVGPANRMLSYVWAYTVGDIVTCLETYCAQKNLNTKDTYIWICCLCNNQHRVTENVPFETFHEIFRDTVVGVGHILAMMTPWDKPLYLTRVWCIFEVFTADATDGCEVEIIMPPQEKDDMMESLHDYDSLVKALISTDIEKAQASKEDDRRNIMQLVNESTGASALNINVNKLLRDCIKKMLLAAVDDYGVSELCDESIDLKYANFCFRVGRVMLESNDYDKALVLYKKALAVQKKVLGVEHKNTTTTLFSIAMALECKGDLDHALELYHECLKMRKKVLGEDHILTASTYNNIAVVMNAKGNLDGAVEMHKNAIAVKEKLLGEDHTDTALSYSNVAEAMSAKGDLGGAMVMHKKALAVREEKLGEEHIDTAHSYNNVGSVMRDEGSDLDGALNMYHKCLAVFEKVLGDDHTSTATTYNNIAMIMYMKGEIDGALNMLNKCLAVQVKTLGEEHPSTANTRYGINFVMKAKGN